MNPDLKITPQLRFSPLNSDGESTATDE